MKALHFLISTAESVVWVFGSSSERLEAEIQNRRRLIRRIISFSTASSDPHGRAVWRNLAYGHLTHIKHLEAKRLQYVMHSVWALTAAMLLLVWAILSFVYLGD